MTPVATRESLLERGLGWLGAISGLGGSLALAADLSWAPWVFAAWLLSNLAWSLHSWRVCIWSQGAMQLGYAAINTLGVYRHFGVTAGLTAGLLTLSLMALLLRGMRQGTACAAESVRVRVIGWLGSGSGMLGSLVIALALGGERWGFPIWIVSNTAWLIHAWRTRVWSQAVMQMGYFGINAVALSNYFGLSWAVALMAYLSLLLVALVGHDRKPSAGYAG